MAPKARGRKLLKKEKRDEFAPEKDHHAQGDELPTETLQDNDGSSNQAMFYGVLDRDELEYFKQAEATLGMDAFESREEKGQFVTSVIEEARGKELKLVTSQICSKLVERLILDCDDSQLKGLFKAFNGNFYGMACHKYASHVLETLLVRSAALVEKELLTPSFDDENVAAESNGDDEYGSMENMFLFMLNELKPHAKLLMSDQYGSHTLRLVILILASKILPSSTQSNSNLRSKKSKIARKMIDIKDNDEFNKTYQTPESFKLELRALVSGLYKSFTGDVASRSDVSPSTITKFRELCVDKVASPVIQLIIQVEGIFDRDRSFWRLIFNTNDERDAKEESFVEYLLSDAVGSHFLQNVIGYGRQKYVERLYRLYMRERVVKLAKRDTTGAFVVQALLLHLKGKEIRQILDDIVPELSVLLNSNIDFGTAIINASNTQDSYLRDEIIGQLLKKYYPAEQEERNVLESCLQLSSSTLGNTRDDWPTAEERRRSIFLEQLIAYDQQFMDVTVESMLALPEERLLQMCYHGVFSHVVESVLDPKRVEIIQRRRLLNVLCKDVVNMACNAYGSHIMDKLWNFTAKLMLYKERIAGALVGESEKVKNSTYGRQVWKNWQLEKYVRKRWDWKGLVKDQERELFPPVEKPVVAPGHNDRYDRNEARETHNKKHGRDSSNHSDRSRKRQRPE
ncbi:similar to Saccharomyces cerevisiae YJL010C NOP9 Essential subunit of U3-containing 90S preribosome involved in production of 18S rRNA and assembly of small ribosomal subunit [Maudiozyma saulgeensis]|uniref:Nucleolar protein 9 n=1 Tax=Maudiozyma saulgeensis TaxID=1789683 RepID=A0A1X7R4M9_9SACH|nr:similar to Saccharomyces cerevisiae YJL010C NOP9 Essential subunit of U3-containing 90S preribosome involved in production of 18S rRNA and assembly of small ribosomal subunit [Kazachstania saulgeensis]